MALKIASSMCTACSACEPECPNGAISEGELIYEIDPDFCTDCVGHYKEPQCIKVCPVECIIHDPERVEDSETLQRKFLKLNPR